MREIHGFEKKFTPITIHDFAFSLFNGFTIYSLAYGVFFYALQF